jgi:hypothetical protein
MEGQMPFLPLRIVNTNRTQEVRKPVLQVMHFHGMPA